MRCDMNDQAAVPWTRCSVLGPPASRRLQRLLPTKGGRGRNERGEREDPERKAEFLLQEEASRASSSSPRRSL
jgi:hypothetical protein